MIVNPIPDILDPALKLLPGMDSAKARMMLLDAVSQHLHGCVVRHHENTSRILLFGFNRVNNCLVLWIKLESLWQRCQHAFRSFACNG